MLAAAFFASPPPRGTIIAMPVVTVEAFSREAAELRPLLRAVAASVLHVPIEHPDVDDAVGETMRRAIEGRERLRSGEPMRAWMVGITKHVALDVARMRTRTRARVTLPTPTESSRDLTERVPDSKPSPFDHTARSEEVARLDAALRELPPKQREAIILFFIEGESYVAIGKKLGVPMGTVATWILRGRKALAAILSDRSQR